MSICEQLIIPFDDDTVGNGYLLESWLCLWLVMLTLCRHKPTHPNETAEILMAAVTMILDNRLD
jgi:hypothetical protein